MSKYCFEEWYYRFLMNRNSKKNDNVQEIELIASCKETATLLPDDGINGLFESDDCLLCADENDRRKRECYAQTDLGHEKPDKRQDIKHSDIAKGSYLPLNISCCKRCRRNYLAAELIPTVLGIVIMAIAIILIGNRAVRDTLIERITIFSPAVRPFLVFVLVFAITLTVTALLRRLLYDVFSKKTHFDLFEINDTMRILKALGWFKLYEKSKGALLMFSKELPKYLRECSKSSDEISDFSEVSNE